MIRETFAMPSEQTVSDAVSVQEKPTVPFKMIGSEEQTAVMTSLINRVAESDFGREILEDACALGYTLRMDDLGRTTKGVCRGRQKEIVLSSRMSEDVLVLTLAHEGRHAGQIGRGAIAGYMPECSLSSLVPHKRLMEADAVTASIVVAEELLQKGDYMPVSMARRDYTDMTEAYEQNLEKGEPQQEAMTQCALKWYDNTPRKMAYEEDHIMMPLSQGFYALNKSGGYSDLNTEAGMRAICSFQGGMYFSDPGALKTPERAGMSSYTAQWVKKHIEECGKKTGADVSDVVAGLPVYAVSEEMAGLKERRFGPAPAVLSEKGAQRIKAAVKAGTLKKEKAVALAPILLNKRLNSR
ncbi:MAG: hypothetical protein IJ752_01015 [Alphaproteobacteria bacterium]|nr:hypothetical protein [Alphaproteobacteria bacterium]